MNFYQKLSATNDPFAANLCGIILIGTIIAIYADRYSSERKQDRRVLAIVIGILIYCVSEFSGGLLEGYPGPAVKATLYLFYSLLFLINMMLAYQWVYLIAEHVGYNIRGALRIAMIIPFAVGCLLLFCNLFAPVIFWLDENNHNEFGMAGLFFYGAAGFYFIYALFIYVRSRLDGGVLKYFPVWLYFIPSIIGMVFELEFSISMLGTCNAIGIAAILSSLQMERILRDGLTGLYNHSYLDELKNKLEKSRSSIGAIMLDMNSFKQINDNFGHAEGDRALITTSLILRQTVGIHGDVIRYAGDEFIVFLNTVDEARIIEVAGRLREAFDRYNSTSGKQYNLSASMGFAVFNPEVHTVNQFLNEIDHNMYLDKQRYYEECGGSAMMKER